MSARLAGADFSSGTDVALPEFLTSRTLRLVLFGGKGGVGKTTCASAAAVRMAMDRPGEKFLLISTDPAHSTGDCVGGRGAGSLPPNLTLVEIDAAAEHAAFMAEHGEVLREIAVRGTFLDEGDVDQFLSLSLPGIDELAAFLGIARFAAAGEHACIVVDTAPTGHALRLLQMAGFLGRWLEAMDALMAKHRYMAGLFGAGPKKGDRCEAFIEQMQGTIAGLGGLMTDHALCRFVPVMLAETLSVLETGDLLGQLSGLDIAVGDVVVNRLIPSAEQGAGLVMVREAQRAVLSALPLQIAALRVWAQPLCGREVIGAELLATFYDALMPPGALRSWIMQPIGVAGASAAPAASGRVVLPSAARRLIVVAGKGGVGKTTTSASVALALGAGEPSRRVLIASTDPAHSLADALACGLTSEPMPIGESGNVFAMELDAAAEFESLASAYRDELEALFDKLMEGADLAFDREVLERLLDLAPPGIDEVMALVRVVELLETKDDARRFDTIVLDTAPSGHTLRLLALPALIEQWLASIFRVLLKYQRLVKLPKLQKRLVELSRGTKKLGAMLKDGTTACVLPVAIPTNLALEETKDLVAACRKSGLSVPSLVLNLVTPLDEGSELSAAVVARERSVIESFDAGLGEIPRATVMRGSAPRGAAALTALGKSIVGAPAAAIRRAA